MNKNDARYASYVQILKEGDKIELFHNIYLEVLETPGHCPSCLTYYTDNYEQLLKEANRALHSASPEGRSAKLLRSGPVWACGGAVFTALLWLATALL